MYIIVGLGNPGKEYEKTRHNSGFMVIDELAKYMGIEVNKKKFKAEIGEGIIKGEKVILVKPQTYMNNSGESIIELVKYYKIDLDRLVVIYDDIDLDVGRIRIRKSGSAGTHNGMRSIVNYLDNTAFPRIRVGIGKNQVGDLVNHVLGKFKGDELEIISDSIIKASEAARIIVSDGIDTAMNKMNV